MDELKKWLKTSGLPVKKFFNTSGAKYKELGISQKLPQLSDEEALEILATDGMLVKRPLMVSEKFVLVGFKAEDWEKSLK